MPRKSILVLILLTLFCWPLFVLAQTEGTSVAVGDTINGELTTDKLSDLYVLQGRAGDIVDVTLTSTEFDTFLTLTGPDGAILLTDDDSGGDGNARIVEFTLPTDGEYSIRVDSYNLISTGAYTLVVDGTFGAEATAEPTATATPDATPLPLDPGGVLAYGQSVEGSIDAAIGTVSFTFEGAAGDVVTVDLLSPDFDAYLVLQGPDGDELAADDDSAGNLNARIDAFPLPSDGIYTLVASSYGGSAEGAFTLTLTSGDAVVVEPTQEATVTPEPGQTDGAITGVLSNDRLSAVYTFQGTAGDVVTFTLNSEDFDTYLELDDSTGRELISDDDSGDGFNAQIANYTLPEDASYTLTATSNNRLGTGSFTLEFSGAALNVEPVQVPTVEPTASATAIAAQGGDIALNQNVSGVLDAGDATNAYTFTVSDAATVTIDVASDDFDPFVALQSADGSELASDDDSAGNLNARIETFALPGAGSYTVVVSSSGGTGLGGSFTLLVSTGAIVIEPTATPEVVAEPGSSIAFGEVITGELTSDGGAIFTFEGRAGDAVTITAESEDFDAFLTLSDASGSPLTTDDDSAGNLNARIENFVLPADGTYSISVSSFSVGSSGSFTLSLASGSTTLEPTPLPSGGDIALGDSVSGELSDGGSTVSYSFQGEVGQSVTITLTSEDFDTFVRLEDPDGLEIASDDDSAGSLDSRITAFTLTENGLYSIVVESYDGLPGSFTLTLAAAQLESIALGDTISTTIDGNGEIDLYSFSGEAGEVITISMTSADFDTYLSLSFASDSFPLIENDDSAGTDSLIGPFTLPQTGDYVISARAYDAAATGSYTLVLTKAELITIEYGATVDAQFSAEQSSVYYSFEATAGDLINVTVDASLDTSITLNGPDGFNVASDSDGGAGYNPELFRQLLSQSGLYTLVLQSTIPGTNGTAALTLERTAAPSLDEGPQDIQLTDTQYEAVVSFAGQAGQTVRLTVEVVSAPAQGSPYITVSQGDTDLTFGYMTNVSELIFEIVVPSDGTVNVQISDYDFNTVALRVTLERGGLG
jgi:hypothetical protein